MSRLVKVKLQVNKNKFFECAQKLGFKVISNDGITRIDLTRPITVEEDGYLSYDNMDARQVSEVVAEYVADMYGGQVTKKGNTIYVEV